MLVRRSRRGPGWLALTIASIVGIAGGVYMWKPLFDDLRKGQYVYYVLTPNHYKCVKIAQRLRSLIGVIGRTPYTINFIS